MQVTSEDIRRALAGEDPPTGVKLTQDQLGRQLAAHRRGDLPGQPYRRASISLYLKDPGKAGPDFAEAFNSWRSAARAQQPLLRLRFDTDMTLREMVEEMPAVVQLGDGPMRTLLLLGDLPENQLLKVNGSGELVVCNAEFGECSCGAIFVKRAHNHRWCSPGCEWRREFERLRRRYPDLETEELLSIVRDTMIVGKEGL